MNLLISEFKTYSHDLPLLEKLGLKPFKGETYEKIYVGKYIAEGGSWAEIWVEGAPAQFFTFKIYCSENKTITIIATGSGCLTDYWSVVESVMDGMIVIENLKKVKMGWKRTGNKI